MRAHEFSDVVSAGAEAGDVRATVDGVDVVGERDHVLGERVVVLERDLDARGADHPLDVDGAAFSTSRRRFRCRTKLVTPPWKKKFFSESVRSSVRRIQRPLLR